MAHVQWGREISDALSNKTSYIHFNADCNLSPIWPSQQIIVHYTTPVNTVTLPSLRELDLVKLCTGDFIFYFFKRSEYAVAAWTYIRALQNVNIISSSMNMVVRSKATEERGGA